MCPGVATTAQLQPARRHHVAVAEVARAPRPSRRRTGAPVSSANRAGALGVVGVAVGEQRLRHPRPAGGDGGEHGRAGGRSSSGPGSTTTHRGGARLEQHPGVGPVERHRARVGRQHAGRPLGDAPPTVPLARAADGAGAAAPASSSGRRRPLTRPLAAVSTSAPGWHRSPADRDRSATNAGGDVGARPPPRRTRRWAAASAPPGRQVPQQLGRVDPVGVVGLGGQVVGHLARRAQRARRTGCRSGGARTPG